jgi:hypothetical protein
MQSVSAADIHHVLLGYKITEGFLPYLHIRDNIAPLSALVYYLLSFLGDYTLIAHYITSMVLLFIQAITVNQIIASHRANRELSNLPAYTYILFACLVPDFASLSPIVISLTFLVIAIAKLSEVLTQKQSEDAYYSIGFHLGLAILADAVALIYISAIMWVLLAYTDSNAKRISLFLIGTLFPLVILGMALYWLESLSFAIEYLSVDLFNLNILNNIQSWTNFYWLFPPAVFTGYAILFGFTIRGYNLTQQRIRNLFFSWLIFTLLALFFLKDPWEDAHFMLLLPACAYYFGSYLLSAKMRWLASIFSLLLILQGVSVNMGILITKIPAESLSILKNPNVDVTTLVQGLSGDQGPQKTAGGIVGWQVAAPYPSYFGGNLESVYLHPQITLNELKQVNDYRGVDRIHQAFSLQLPTRIEDPAGILEPVWKRLPGIRAKYAESEPGIFELIP